MEIPIFEHGARIGALCIETHGLYHIVRASCSPKSEGVLRLYGWKGRAGMQLGVLCPENGAFTLEKRLSVSSLPVLPELAVVGRMTDGYLPFRGGFEGCQIADGYWKNTEQGDCVAIPVEDGMECPFADRLQQTAEEMIGGKPYLVLCPWLPIEDQTQEPVEENEVESEQESARFHTEPMASEP